MFSDPDRGRSSQEKETKVKYTFQFGIALYTKNNLMSEIFDLWFCFKLDESVTYIFGQEAIWWLYLVLVRK